MSGIIQNVTSALGPLVEPNAPPPGVMPSGSAAPGPDVAPPAPSQ
jgi:hypothetical protein